MVSHTETTVIKIALRAMPDRGADARAEAARLWNRMARLHRWFRIRQRAWPSKSDFEKHFKGRFQLHSQTVQALIGRFFSNIDTTRTLRRNGNRKARYPWRMKRYLSVPWKGQAVRIKGRYVTLPMGRGRSGIRLKLPTTVPPGKIVAAELGFCELGLSIKRTLPMIRAGAGVAAMDPIRGAKKSAGQARRIVSVRDARRACLPWRWRKPQDRTVSILAGSITYRARTPKTDGPGVPIDFALSFRENRKICDQL